jgi:hypothetical protein
MFFASDEVPDMACRDIYNSGPSSSVGGISDPMLASPSVSNWDSYSTAIK